MQQQQRIINTIIRKLVMGKVVMTPATAGFLSLIRNERKCISQPQNLPKKLYQKGSVRNFLELLDVRCGAEFILLFLSAANYMLEGGRYEVIIVQRGN
jgi:hypothetical protein